jgi:inhibitor of KinA sporulation pathway (predicted exonuclease)
LGIPFVGRTHNALDDARSLAAGMEVIAARVAHIRPAA